MTMLTAKQRMFVVEYLKDLNGTQAAIRAGYSVDSAQQIGSENLSKPLIAEAIERAMKRREERTQVTVNKVVEELAKMAFSNLGDYFTVLESGEAVVDLTGADDHQLAALSEITVDEYVEGRGDDARAVKRVKIKMADKQAALVQLGRHLGMFNDKLRLEDLRERSDDDIAKELRELVGVASKIAAKGDRADTGNGATGADEADE